MSRHGPISRRLLSTSSLSRASSPSPASHVTASQEFYRNQLIEQYAQERATPTGLRQFIFFGRKLDSTRLFQSANFVRKELPIRLAHRIRSMQDLPYVVGMNANLQTVRRMYVDAFEKIRRFPSIKTLEDNERFCDFMRGKMAEHLSVIPLLAVGIAETEGEMSAAHVDTFMHNMLRSRISRRVLTQQHLALTQQYQSRDHRPSHDTTSSDRFIGVIDTQLDPAALAQRCADLISDQADSANRPPIVVECIGDAHFVYVPDHLEYMLYELMKNSARSTTERFGPAAADHTVRVTVISADREIIIRISDEGGGIPPITPLPHAQTAERAAVFSFVHIDETASNHTKRAARPGKLDALRSIPRLGGTVKEQIEPPIESGDATVQLHSRLGIGLPLSRIYAEFFGGSLKLFSSTGHGTDAYLRIPKVQHQSLA